MLDDNETRLKKTHTIPCLLLIESVKSSGEVGTQFLSGSYDFYKYLVHFWKLSISSCYHIQENGIAQFLSAFLKIITTSALSKIINKKI